MRAQEALSRGGGTGRSQHAQLGVRGCHSETQGWEGMSWDGEQGGEAVPWGHPAEAGMTPSWAGKLSLLHQRSPELIEKHSAGT